MVEIESGSRFSPRNIQDFEIKNVEKCENNRYLWLFDVLKARNTIKYLQAQLSQGCLSDRPRAES